MHLPSPVTILKYGMVDFVIKIRNYNIKKGKENIKVSKEFGNFQRIMNILDKHKMVLLSMITLKEPEEEDWLTVLRAKSKDAEPMAKELKTSGFNVTYVG